MPHMLYIRLAPEICWCPEACRMENKNSTWCQRLRRLQRSRLELSAGRTPSFIADCCNVCQAVKNSRVFVPELAYLRAFILCCTNVLIIIITIRPLRPAVGIRVTCQDARLADNRAYARTVCLLQRWWWRWAILVETSRIRWQRTSTTV